MGEQTRCGVDKKTPKRGVTSLGISTRICQVKWTLGSAYPVCAGISWFCGLEFNAAHQVFGTPYFLITSHVNHHTFY